VAGGWWLVAGGWWLVFMVGLLVAGYLVTRALGVIPAAFPDQPVMIGVLGVDLLLVIIGMADHGLDLVSLSVGTILSLLVALADLFAAIAPYISGLRSCTGQSSPTSPSTEAALFQPHNTWRPPPREGRPRQAPSGSTPPTRGRAIAFSR